MKNPGFRKPQFRIFIGTIIYANWLILLSVHEQFSQFQSEYLTWILRIELWPLSNNETKIEALSPGNMYWYLFFLLRWCIYKMSSASVSFNWSDIRLLTWVSIHRLFFIIKPPGLSPRRLSNGYHNAFE